MIDDTIICKKSNNKWKGSKITPCRIKRQKNQVRNISPNSPQNKLSGWMFMLNVLCFHLLSICTLLRIQLLFLAIPKMIESCFHNIMCISYLCLTLKNVEIYNVTFIWTHHSITMQPHNNNNKTITLLVKYCFDTCVFMGIDTLL